MCKFIDQSDVTPINTIMSVSQLDTTEAVYPDLTSCSISVDKILPQLTSSLWYVYCIYRIFLMSVEAFSTDIIVFIGVTSDWSINLHMRGKNWPYIFVDQTSSLDIQLLSCLTEIVEYLYNYSVFESSGNLFYSENHTNYINITTLSRFQ
jgi:hypothetical protein